MTDKDRIAQLRNVLAVAEGEVKSMGHTISEAISRLIDIENEYEPAWASAPAAQVADDACLAADWAKWALDSLAIALGRLEALGEDYPPDYEQLDRQARNVVAAIRDRQSTDKKSPAQEER